MRSKRFNKLPKKTLDLPSQTIEKLIAEVKKNCTTKFDESIDLSFQINHKQKKNEVNIRTVVNLPGGTGKSVKVAVVCEEEKSNEAKEAGADIFGGDDFIEKIKTYEKKYPSNNVPRPPHWSGWRLMPSQIEFWLDGEGRIHERLNYKKENGSWKRELLYP